MAEHVENQHSGHETQDAHVLPIVATLASLAVGAAMVALLVYGIFRYLADHPLSATPPNPMAETSTQQFPPTPRIEEHPAIEMQDLLSQEDKILTTYGWTDKNLGIVRIPIDQAMELQLKRGFPIKEAAKK
jgi:hypothetical protein